MDDQRVGAAFRSIRIRRRLRRIERGHLDEVSLGTIRAIGKALDIRIDLTPRWRAGDLDRLLNARHSRLHELVAQHMAELPGWVMRPEVSFAVYGERGVIDILAWHPRRRMLLVIELKTDIVDVNDLVGSIDRKRRHAIRIATDLGWIPRGDPPAQVATWVIVADSATNRRRVRVHQSMLRAAFPSDGRSIRSWLRRPIEPINALSFWANAELLPRGARLSPPRRVSRARIEARRSA
jgi:hypothetical protein